MSLRLRLAVIVLVFSAVFSCVLFNPQAFDQALLNPLYRFFWLAWLVLLSPDQVVWWAVLVLVVVLAAGRAILSRKGEASFEETTGWAHPQGAWIRPWLNSVLYAHGVAFRREAARSFRSLAHARSFRSLAHYVASHDEQEPVEGLKTGRTAAVTLPPEVEAFLAGLETSTDIQSPRWTNPFSGLAARLFRRRYAGTLNVSSTARTAGLEALVSFLENQLEIRDTNENR